MRSKIYVHTYLLVFGDKNDKKALMYEGFCEYFLPNYEKKK